MHRILAMLTAILLPFSLNTHAVDLNGTVTTSNGVPICALVLASGRSMFSCNPSGPYALNGLPTEPDGSVNLQVYAAGFQPYFQKLFTFGTQNVVMQRAGIPPVDDGLSDTSPMDGTYRLMRVTLVYNNGNILDAAQSNVSVSGAFIVEDGRYSQSISITLDGLPGTIGTSGSLLDDLGYAYTTLTSAGGGGNSLISVLERGRKHVTLLDSAISGLPYSEVNYWKKVAGAESAAALNASRLTYGGAYNSFAGQHAGGLFGELVEAHGLRDVLSR